MNETSAEVSAAKLIAMINAAAVIMRPVWARPRETLSSLAACRGAGAIISATGGHGADSVIDAVGTDTSMTDAINAVRPGGTVSVVGLHDLQPLPLPALPCLLRSITPRMTTAPVQRTWPELIPLLASGPLDVDGIFTARMPLDEAVKGYAIAGSRSGEQVKVLLTP
ncbi:putative zinc-binding alcohol dehydrogenase [Mycobacterium innocens]|uniref:Putative zinc-binding alcohol dehydrogenase n=1 Tax=Mycobacterium innocens TaxID=2341083 RepID=A0A498PYC5_9MYCO|nr:putative zinc-binding alcohol dehydrogenase [Mycobacterium innocens]